MEEPVYASRQHSTNGGKPSSNGVREPRNTGDRPQGHRSHRKGGGSHVVRQPVANGFPVNASGLQLLLHGCHVWAVGFHVADEEEDRTVITLIHGRNVHCLGRQRNREIGRHCNCDGLWTYVRRCQGTAASLQANRHKQKEDPPPPPPRARPNMGPTASRRRAALPSHQLQKWGGPTRE